MTNRRTLRKVLSELVLAAFMLVCLLLVGLIHRNPGLTRYAYAPYAFFVLQPEEVTEEAIPGYAGLRRSFTFSIPEGSATTIGARISFYLRHTNAEISIDDSALIYDSSELDTPHIGQTPGN